MGLLASPLATAASFRKYASPSVAEPTDAPYEGTDEQLLEEIQRASFGPKSAEQQNRKSRHQREWATRKAFRQRSAVSNSEKRLPSCSTR